MFAKKRLVLWLTLAAALALLAGCVDQDSPTSPSFTDQPDLKALLDAPYATNWPSASLAAGYPWPDSPEQAIANFRAAYDDRSVSAYAAMLAPDFQFILQPATIEQYHLPRGILDASDEIRIAFNMCLGLPSQGGERLTDIEVVRLEPLSIWEPVPQDDPHFGTRRDAQRRSYDVLMAFAREGQSVPYTVRGQIQLLVIPETVVIAGSSRTAYRLIGGYDETGRGTGADEILWGSLKVLFR